MLRQALRMPILTAVPCHLWLASYSERLVALGNAGKLAVVAARRKPLAAVWSVAEQRRPFRAETFSRSCSNLGEVLQCASLVSGEGLIVSHLSPGLLNCGLQCHLPRT